MAARTTVQAGGGHIHLTPIPVGVGDDHAKVVGFHGCASVVRADTLSNIPSPILRIKAEPLRRLSGVCVANPLCTELTPTHACDTLEQTVDLPLQNTPV